MSALFSILHVILLILVVLTVFNIIIFVHELGHFLAAKWRGLKIDRFQIWFGKPIWKKEINGVQYGLGCIPAGGFVALPQMAPMEAIEGGEKPSQPLPPITPLDKIIVAFAGPLFSILLAFLAAVIVWQVGKPKDFIDTQEIGFVKTDSPAAKAHILPGDKVIAINGQKVDGFAGSLNSISERIILSRGKTITFTVERPGEAKPLDLTAEFEVPTSGWLQRLLHLQRGELRDVGIDSASPAIIGSTMPHSPAADVGLNEGDQIIAVDGASILSWRQFPQLLKEKQWATVHLTVKTAKGETREVDLTPKRPIKPTGLDPMAGIAFGGKSDVDTRLVYPKPIEQVTGSLRMMWTTISSVAAKDSNIDVSHLSGPVGIGSAMFQFLQMENGWRRILWFMVLFNVNLAVLNMLPFPVLDGGHITLAILEKIFGRPVQAKPLEILQTFCALALITLMLFVSSKDTGDLLDRLFGRGEKSREIVFPE